MTERCVVKVEFDPATSGTPVRRAVSGFLRYIQHRDLHPAPTPSAQARAVAGMVKYVAYRDRASSRAELFGPQGSVGTPERKDFVGFVSRSIEGSQPQIFRTRAGLLMDRRRLVSRFFISPESASGLDLQCLARAAVSRLESEMGVRDLRWIAAIHRNTAHHHAHLVLAGMRVNGSGGFSRVEITKPRLAAMKEAIHLEIERQRGQREPTGPLPKPTATEFSDRDRTSTPTLEPLPPRPVPFRKLPVAPPPRLRVPGQSQAGFWSRKPASGSLLVLRAVARRYSRQMQRELEREAQRFGRERAA